MRAALEHKEVSKMRDEWKKSLPFPRHWLSYIGYKLLILVIAAFIAWQILRAFEVL
jgi:hypothetical protein